jgi:hypothetical protein
VITSLVRFTLVRSTRMRGYSDQYSIRALHFVGAVDRGFWPARPQDTGAVPFTYNTASGQLGKIQAQEAELDLSLSNQATGLQTHEMILEVNYNIHEYRDLSFQPDFQYMIRSNDNRISVMRQCSGSGRMCRFEASAAVTDSQRPLGGGTARLNTDGTDVVGSNIGPHPYIWVHAVTIERIVDARDGDGPSRLVVSSLMTLC